MKTTILLRATAWVAAMVAPLLLHAQDFTSGSTGSYGAMNITATTTLPLPADGIFHCTTITVASGATLTFTRNALNTPVHLLATGDVLIDGTIDVSSGAPADGNGRLVGGTGGPGGFDGGATGFISAGNTRQAGSGQGPGGGRRDATNANGSGSYATKGSTQRGGNGAVYGNALLIPLVGGSGGGGADGTDGQYGGGGGGAICIASTSKITVNGTIRADGTYVNGAGAGSGGAIRLVSPRVYGTGTLSASSYGNWGGHGRIRIDSVVKVEPGDLSQKLALAYQGSVTVGSTLMVFAPNNPRLDIIGIQDAGGNMIQAIPLDTTGPVTVTLPNGTPFDVRVLVAAKGFRADNEIDTVNVNVAVIPESTTSVIYNGSITGTVGTAGSATAIPVQIPPNVKCTIQVWSPQI
jgi:hypothetical protein